MMHTIEKLDGVSVIVIQGDLWGGEETCQMQGRIKEDVTELVSRGARKFILDLDRVDRINSIGIGVLVAIHASIQNAGAELRVCSVGPRPKAALEITGLMHLFRTYATREAAAEAFTAAV